jgi:potassium-transporting ATPase KdpC subunit
MRRDIISSLLAVVVLTAVLGLAYPLLTTGVAQVLFPDEAEGSRVEREGRTVGSSLIAQDFGDAPEFFHSRPSATEYDGAGTAFNNLGPNNQELSDTLRENREAYEKREQLEPGEEVPVDAVTFSGSSVDPHISEENAEIQARRVSEARGVPLEEVLDMVDEHTDGRGLGVLGEPGVNVLELNLALEELS